ncbi:MAG: peptidoglycan-binding protein LysM [Chlorobiales bacterium]|jgi:nucleoid-associated protein YgaU|nr:peptidoglycan-binding protein LysM [Chlorobiales bacterium]
MGFIDFIKDVGAGIFKGGNQAKEIEELLNKDLSGKIKDLKVEFKDGAVTLAGAADSVATKEKAVLLAGNIKGVEKVMDDKLTAPPPPPNVPPEVTEYYTVKSGDTLSKIAKSYYGDAAKYPVIFEANREVIKNPDLIYPGQKLRIPKK